MGEGARQTCLEGFFEASLKVKGKGQRAKGKTKSAEAARCRWGGLII
jgi:hypothetical protein